MKNLKYWYMNTMSGKSKGQPKRVTATRLFSVSGQLPLDFVKWYSGMEEEKILKAYERWITYRGLTK